MKQAVIDKFTPEGVSWATIFAAGNHNLAEGQFLSTVVVKTNKSIRTIGTVYKVIPGGLITQYDRNENTGVIQSLNISSIPGQGEFPHCSMLRAVRTSKNHKLNH